MRSRPAASQSPAPPQLRAAVSDSVKNSSAKGNDKQNSSMDDDELGMEPDGDMKAGSPRLQEALLVKGIFEVAFPRWKDLVRAKGEEEGRPCGLERFDCGTLFVLSPDQIRQ